LVVGVIVDVVAVVVVVGIAHYNKNSFKKKTFFPNFRRCCQRLILSNTVKNSFNMLPILLYTVPLILS